MLKVLTIFENSTQSRSLNMVLHKMKAKVISCEKKYTSFLKTVQYEPHIILIELSKATMDEFRLLQLIRKNRDAMNVPILVHGPNIQKKFQENIIHCGANEYFTQPIDLKEFLVTLNSYASKHIADIEREKEELDFDENDLSPKEEQIVLSLKQPLSKKLDILEMHIHKLLAFPTTVVHVLQLTDSDTSSASQLGKVIESDTSVAAEILKLSNSVYFAARDKRISSLREAVVRIGFEQTKKAVVSMSVIQHVSSSNNSTGFSHTDFWFHSVAVAIIAEMLAKKASLVNPDEAFVFGLLHELGILLYNEYFNRIFLRLLQKSTSQGLPFSYLQKNELKLTHNDLMARLSDSWGFSREFTEGFKALDEMVPTMELLKHSPLAAITLVADSIALSLGIGKAADCGVYPIPKELLNTIGLKGDLNAAFIDRIYREVNMYNSMLDIESCTFPTNKRIMEENDQITIINYINERRTWNPLQEYLKEQGYCLINVYSEEELIYSLKTEENPLFYFPEVTNEDIQILIDCKDLGYKGIVFDPLHLMPQGYEARGVVVGNYPIDMRNIDMVIHAIHMGYFDLQMTSRLKTLLPIKRADR